MPEAHLVVRVHAVEELRHVALARHAHHHLGGHPHVLADRLALEVDVRHADAAG
jgi:hypothetical protein